MFLPHFGIFINLLLKRQTVAWNLYSIFILLKNKENIVNNTIYASIHPTIDYKKEAIKLRKKSIYQKFLWFI